MSDNTPEKPAEIEATNASLSEFVAQRVRENHPELAPADDGGDKKDEKTSDSKVELDPKAPLGDDDEKVKDVLEDKEEKEKVDETKKEGEKDDDKKKDEKDEKVDDKKDEKADEEKEEKVEELPEGKPVPYDRFQEVNREKTELRQQIEQYKPALENYDNIRKFCHQNQITPDQYEKALQVQALLNTNPEEALKHLLPIVESLQGFVGNKLPEDLQKEVDAGDLKVERAREIAKLRAQTTFKENLSKQREETQQKMAEQQAISATTKAAGDWERQRRATDPDYKPKANEAAPDGLWEDVHDKFSALLHQQDAQGNYVNPVHSPQQMVALQERAYKLVKDKWTTRMSPRKPLTKSRLSSNGEGTRGKEDKSVENAPTMADAIKRRLAERGIGA